MPEVEAVPPEAPLADAAEPDAVAAEEASEVRDDLREPALFCVPVLCLSVAGKRSRPNAIPASVTVTFGPVVGVSVLLDSALCLPVLAGLLVVPGLLALVEVGDVRSCLLYTSPSPRD